MSTPIGSAVDDDDTGPDGFQYFGSWGLGQSIPQHYGGTAHYSNVPGSKALLFFRGISVTYFADLDSHLSQAAVSLDGLPPDTVNLASVNTTYQNPVWRKNVTDGDHQLVIEHIGAINTDIMIDYVSLESNGGHLSTSSGPAASDVDSSALFIDDTDPRLSLSPDWSSVTEGLFYNKSSWLTQTPGASAQLTFNGTAIWYFTDTNFDHGAVRIRLDDDDGELASGYSQTPLAQRLIWYKTGLPAGTHTLNITHADSDGKYATLDFFRYVESAGSSPNHKKHLAAGAIVGIVIAGLFLLGILYCTLLCVFRSRSPPANPDAPTAPPAYNRANNSSESSILEAHQQYVDGDVGVPPVGHTIPMGYVVRAPESVRTGVESVIEPSTPAQRYRDSVRASRVQQGSVTDSGVGASAQTPGTDEGDNQALNLIPQLTGTSAPISGPPPYEHPAT